MEGVGTYYWRRGYLIWPGTDCQDFNREGQKGIANKGIGTEWVNKNCKIAGLTGDL